MSNPVTKPRIGILPQEERMAIIEGARKLGLNPYEFGGFLSLESGMNMDPNIVGGAGGRHKGLIQFGQNEQRQYGIAGPQTRAGQMPKVLQYFQDRGFKPGMGIERAYATVLGGNPNVSLNQKDSFGTSVSGASSRFKQGGDLYKNAQRVLGDIPTQSTPATPSTASTSPAQPVSTSKQTPAFFQKLLQQSMLGSGYQSPIRQLLNTELMGVLSLPSSSSLTGSPVLKGLAGFGFPSLF
jgi:hypothetical protein